MVPLTKVDLKDFQVTASGDDPSTLPGDPPPEVQAGSGTARAAGSDQGQIKAYSSVSNTSWCLFISVAADALVMG